MRSPVVYRFCRQQPAPDHHIPPSLACRVIGFVGLTAWAMQSFVRNKFAVLWPLKLLRSIGSFSATVLYIPLFTLLMSGFQCQDEEANPFWVSAGYQCYQGGHLAQTVISAVLAVAFFLLCSLFSLVFYESDSLSNNIVAKSHGRSDFIFLCLKTVLVILVEIFPQHVPTGVLVAALIISGLLWVGCTVFFMPFFHHSWNIWTCAQGCTFLYASICLIVAELYQDNDAAMPLYLGLPFAGITGIYLANQRAIYILRTPAVRLSSPYEIELKARYMLHQGLWGHHVLRGGPMGSNGHAHSSGVHHDHSTAGDHQQHGATVPSAAMAATGAAGSLSMTTSGRGATMRSANDADSTLHNSTRGGATAKPAAGGSSSASAANDRPVPIEEADGSEDVEVRMQAARRLLPPSLISEVHAMYRSACARYRGSAILHVFFSRYYLMQGNRHMQMSHLLQAERRHPPLDVAFLVFQARKLAEDNSGAAGQMSALNRVTFEKYSMDARKFVLRAAMGQFAFWTELLDVQPDLSRLHAISSDMNDAMQAAEKCFAELFAINPLSLSIMRLYAAFNAYVCGNVDKASVLLQEAERIEDQKSKDHRSEGGGSNLAIMAESSLDIMADNTAVITIGGSQRNLGTIISTNAATSKLFGYSRLQLERRNFFTLLPDPLASIMEDILKTYVSTGEGKISSTYIVFGVTKSNAIAPMLLCMRETPADDGPPSFIALMRELRTSDQHILLNADFSITAASAYALEILGVDPSSLAGHDVSIKDFVLEWDHVLPDLKSPRGTTFCIDASSATRAAVISDASMMDNEYGFSQYAATPVPSSSPLSTSSKKSFMRGTIQTLSLDDGGCYYVLHCQRLNEADQYGMAKAHKRRRESLVALGVISPNAMASPSSQMLMNQFPETRVPERSIAPQVQLHGAPAGVGGSVTPVMAIPHPYQQQLVSNAGARHPIAKQPSATALPVAPVASDAASGVTAVKEIQSTIATGAAGAIVRRNSAVAAALVNDTIEFGNPLTASLPHAVEEVPGSTSHAPSAQASRRPSGEGGNKHASQPAAAPEPTAPLPHVDSSIGAVPVDTDRVDESDGSATTLGDSRPAMAVQLGSTAPAAGTLTVDQAAPKKKVGVRVLSEAQVLLPKVRAPVSNVSDDDAASDMVDDGSDDGASAAVRSRTNTGLAARVPTGATPRSAMAAGRSAGSAAPARAGAAAGFGRPPMLPSGMRSGSVTRDNFEGANADNDEYNAGGSRGSGIMGGGGDGAHSVSSGTSYGKRTLSRLRRVLADSNHSMLRGLHYLRIVGIAITILSIALAAAVASIVNTQFSNYRENLVYTSKGADRIQRVFGMVMGTQDLHFAARGWVPMTNVTEAASRHQLYDNATAFSKINTEMYTMVQGTELAHSYIMPAITETRYDTNDAGNLGKFRKINMLTAGLDLSGTAAQISKVPLANLSSERYGANGGVALILVNGVSGGNTHEVINDSMESGYGASLVTRSQVQYNLMCVYAGMSALLLLIAVLVFIPILLSIESAKDAIVTRFVYLPHLVRVALHRQAEKRAMTIRRNHSEDDDDDDEGFGNEDEEAGGMHQVDGQRGMDQDDDEDDVDWDQVIATVNNASSGEAKMTVSRANAAHSASSSAAVYPADPHGHHHHDGHIGADSHHHHHGLLHKLRGAFSPRVAKPSAYRKGSSSVLLLFAKFLGPLVALFLFFTTIFIVSSNTLNTTLSLSSAQVSAANRATCSRELLMDLRRTVMITQDRNFLIQEKSSTEDTADCIEYQQHLLLFGDTTGGPRGEYDEFTPIIETGRSPLLNDIENEWVYSSQFGNACPFIQSATSSSTDLEGCESFSDGIMKQGLIVAAQEYVRRARMLLDRRMRARLLEGSSTPSINPDASGYIIPVSKYNYSVDDCTVGCFDLLSSGLNNGEQPPSPAPDYGVTGDIDNTWDPTLQNATYYSLRTELSNEDFQWMVQMDQLFLTPAMVRLQQMYRDAGVNAIDDFLRFTSVFVSVFLVAYILFMAFVFMPQLKHTNNDVQTKRGMLLFLPPQVIRSVQSIRALVHEILADDANGISRGAATAVSQRGMANSLLLRSSAGGQQGQGGGEGGISPLTMSGPTVGGALPNDGYSIPKTRSFHGTEALKLAHTADVQV